MPDQGKQDQFRLGFLTAVEAPGRGFVGGLLVTNRLGRPLEFQCTTPVKPNRTQEILYGPTLVPFILGELIGRTLIEKAGVKPSLVLVEQAALLELRNHVSVPVVCLADADGSTGSSPSPPAPAVSLGRQALGFHEAHPADRHFVEEHTAAIPRHADLEEPFLRVREALHETLGLAGKGAA